MQLFMYTLQLPDTAWGDREVISANVQPEHILKWTTKELDSRFSGEFGWKKLDSVTICAIQYVNRKQVRLIVRSLNKAQADSMVKSFAWHLDAKKENKRPYSRRCTGVRFIAAGTAIANKHMFKATG